MKIFIMLSFRHWQTDLKKLMWQIQYLMKKKDRGFNQNIYSFLGSIDRTPQINIGRRILVKVISPCIHGYLDFLIVAIFLLAPTVLGLSQLPAMLAYSLAAVHLIVTLASDFPFGMFKLIPFTIHGWIEHLVGPSLIALPFIFGFANEEIARNFYIAMGVVIIAVGILTDYKGQVEPKK